MQLCSGETVDVETTHGARARGEREEVSTLFFYNPTQGTNIWTQA